MTAYISPDKQELLELNHLDDFERVWNHQAEWFEAPNSRRGGWSGVGRLFLSQPQGQGLGVFLKRQQDHQRRTFRHPISGEPTFSCEFNMMQYLQRHGVPAPKPVFFGNREQDGHSQSILMTEELVDYLPLETVTENLFAQGRPSLAKQRSVIRGVAETVRKLHDARIQHRSLYPKHLFVRMRGELDPKVVVIDLEKSRIKLLSVMRTVYDLATLHRHSKYWSATSRLYFFKQYYGIVKLGPWSKLLCRLIHKRASRRKPV